MQSSLLSALLLSAFPLALAHGVVTNIFDQTSGKNWEGPLVNQGFRPAGTSAIRQVYDVAPVTNLNDPALICGNKATPAKAVADVKGGDELLFQWSTGWPHRVGPEMVYMASCGSESCATFDASKAKWFKIAQRGQRPGSHTEWFQSDIANGKPGRVKIPSTIAPGNYLIRYEVVALHIASTLGGAEFYPSCAQLRVTSSSGNSVPSADELVNIPGVYKAEHPGIWTKDIFEPGFVYQFPGPNVARMAGGQGGGGGVKDEDKPKPAPTTTKKAVNPPASPSVTKSASVGLGRPTGAPLGVAPVSSSASSSVSAIPSTLAKPKPRRCGNKRRLTGKQRAANQAKAQASSASAAAATVTPINSGTDGVELNVGTGIVKNGGGGGVYKRSGVHGHGGHRRFMNRMASH